MGTTQNHVRGHSHGYNPLNPGSRIACRVTPGVMSRFTPMGTIQGYVRCRIFVHAHEYQSEEIRRSDFEKETVTT